MEFARTLKENIEKQAELKATIIEAEAIWPIRTKFTMDWLRKFMAELEFACKQLAEASTANDPRFGYSVNPNSPKFTVSCSDPRFKSLEVEFNIENWTMHVHHKDSGFPVFYDRGRICVVDSAMQIFICYAGKKYGDLSILVNDLMDELLNTRGDCGSRIETITGQDCAHFRAQQHQSADFPSPRK